jgi:hypothetical protein
MVAVAIYFGFYLWAKRAGTFSPIKLWEVGRMKDRYESQALNVLALALSLIAAPVGSVLFGLGVFEVFGTDRENLIALVAGLALLVSREIFLICCDLFAKRTVSVV